MFHYNLLLICFSSPVIHDTQLSSDVAKFSGMGLLYVNKGYTFFSFCEKGTPNCLSGL